jgi:serine/threonine protein phosphatase 1
MNVAGETKERARGSRLLALFGFGARNPARMEPGVRFYAVGDIHGCAAQLDNLHAKIAADADSFAGEKRIVYLGDYVDRGPDSRGVIDRLLGNGPAGFGVHCIKGNHEAALLDFLADSQTYRAWRSYGAPETLMSYGVRPPLFDSPDAFEAARVALAGAIPRTHLDFLRTLALTYEAGDYLFVHAGIRPGLDIESQSEADLLWIREDFLGCSATHGKIVVHGHTPVSNPVRLSNRIAVDTGVYATGILTCAVLEGESCRFLQAGRR